MLIALRRFRGQRPRADARLLDDTEAQVAENCKLWEGTLKPWYKPLLEQAAVNTGPILGIYRYQSQYWLHWNADVDVVRGPIAGTTRLYWTGEGAPRVGTLDTIAGISALTATAPGAQAFVLVADSSAYGAGNSVTIALDSGTHTTTITTVDHATKRLNLTVALPSQATAGNLVTKNSQAYPFASYLLGVPAPASALSAAINATVNTGSVVSIVGALGNQSGTSTTTNASYFIDLTGVDGDGESIEFEFEAGFTGQLASTQQKVIRLEVIRDPAGDAEVIYKKEVEHTFQGPVSSSLPASLTSGPVTWDQLMLDQEFLQDLYARRVLGEDITASSVLSRLRSNTEAVARRETVKFQYAAADGAQTYRLQITHEFTIASGESWTYDLRLAARFAGQLGIEFDDVSGLKEGDFLQFAGNEGAGSIAELNKGRVLVLSVDEANDVVYVETNAFGSLTTPGTWTQVWDEEDLEARSYVFTYVATLEGKEMEGPPSPPSAILLVGDNEGVDLTDFVDPTGLGDGRPYTSMRVYRTSTGNDADAEFLFVAEIATGLASYTDQIRGTGLGEIIQSTLWDPPPTDLVGLRELPNGGLAGYRENGNEVCFCVPNQPHAWPSTYRYTVPDIANGLEAFGSSVLVATKGRPNVLIGTDPAVMSREHIEIVHPNLSKRGTVDMGYAILYPTLTGLCYVSSSEARVITKQLFTDDQWKALNPSSFIAAKYHDRYLCFFDDGLGNPGSARGFILDPLDPDATLSFIGYYVTEVWSDPATDELFMVIVNNAGDEEIVKWDGDVTGSRLRYRWRSKEFVVAVPDMATTAQVDAEHYPVQLNIYADGKVYDSIDVPDSDPARVSPKKGKFRKWEVEVIGDTDVEAVYVASNTRMLVQYGAG